MAVQFLARRLGTVCLALALAVFAWAPAAAAGASARASLDNAGCMVCHDRKAARHQEHADEADAWPMLPVPRAQYARGVHAKMPCLDCHTGITDNPPRGGSHHRQAIGATRTAGCVDCHLKLWEAARRDPAAAAAHPRLGKVVENIEAWRQSFHARPNKEDQSKPNASCDNCHDTHGFDIPAAGSPARTAWRLEGNAVCGETCHASELEEYRQSVHGEELIEKHNAKAALCADCHGSHTIGSSAAGPVKLSVTAHCGSCHRSHYQSYKATYHGQISTLGYGNAAKCFNCHGSHDILPASDPDSRVHRDRRMRTCKSCHNGKKGLALAPAGYATFEPHARSDDFAHFPQVWLASRTMLGLLLFTFTFFWTHTALWFWREFKDRQQGRPRPRILTSVLPAAQERQRVSRFSALWRAAHLVFALSLMLLTLTGMPLFYPEAAWAPPVMQALGGPKVAGWMHRVSAVVMIVVFVWHLLQMAHGLWRQRKTFRWLGPDSLVPNVQDLRDVAAMFRWFVGRGPRPVFERWTYWEKFDYWAPFWGVALLTLSGLLMWFPDLAGAHLPGWVFNVAAVLHGEEAILAVVFLFTVHFFNNHFRPEKFPLETLMFTGSMSLDDFRREHGLQYRRLVASGELGQYMVDEPSAPMALGARWLGFALIAFGLVLLAGVAIGFFGGR